MEILNSTVSSEPLSLSETLLIIFWIIEDGSHFSAIFICLFVSIWIPCRLCGRAQMKRKVNILLVLTSWINVFASLFQALADLINDEESYEMTRQVSIATPQVKIYLWIQNIAMVLLFVSRKMDTVIAIYWKTYTTSLTPESVSNWRWWLLHLSLNIPYCLIQGYLYLIPVLDFLLRSPATSKFEIAAMVLGITCQVTSMLTIFYCLVKIGRKMCSDDVYSIRKHYWRLAIGLALKTLALLFPIVESILQTKELIFSPTPEYLKGIESGDSWTIAQAVVHLFRAFYPSLDCLITLGMMWHLMFPKATDISIQIEPATDSVQLRNR